MNLDEREIESVPSAPFSIESSPACAVASLELRAGEIWIEPGATDSRPDRDPVHGDMRTVAESVRGSAPIAVGASRRSAGSRSAPQRRKHDPDRPANRPRAIRLPVQRAALRSPANLIGGSRR